MKGHCFLSIKESWRKKNHMELQRKATNLIAGADPGEGLRGLQPPPLSSICLVFCLILPKIIRKIVFLRSWFTSTIRPLVKLWKDNKYFATFVLDITCKTVVLGSDITGDMNRWHSFKVNEWDWDQANVWVLLKCVQRWKMKKITDFYTKKSGKFMVPFKKSHLI